MPKRMFDSAIFGKVRYHNLDVQSQLLLMYLNLGEETNSTGIFRVNLIDLAQTLKLGSTDEVEEKLASLEASDYIEYDSRNGLVYVKNLTVMNSYHTRELKTNISSMLASLRAAQGSPILRSYYNDHKGLIGSKVLHEVFTALKKEKILSD